ncbi:MAG: lysylphosphatidylglycerol synthase transmembrane domain-containing protein [Anaerolineales bacterium]
MRRLLFLLAISLGAFFVFSRIAELEQVIDSFREGDPAWLGLAIVVQFLWMVNITASFWVIYRILGIRERFFHLGLVVISAQFVSVVAPSGGMGGIAVLIADGNKRGLRSGRVTTGGALFVFFEQFSLLAVVLLGLFFLFRLNQLSAASILAVLVLAGIALVTGLVLFMGMRSPVLLANVLTRLGTILNRMLQPILRRDSVDISRARPFAEDVYEGLQIVRKSPGKLLIPAALAFSSKALLIAILGLIFVAFGQSFTISMLIASFSIGYLFYIVSPTPSGIGFVEGAMTLVMTSLGLSLAVSAVITLTFRGVTFWLTVLYGMLTLRWVGLGQRAPAQSTEPLA